MLAEITLSPHTARLMQKARGLPIPASDLLRWFRSPAIRCEAVLGALYTHYFIYVRRKKGYAYVMTPWGEEPDLKGGAVPLQNNHQKDKISEATHAIMEVAKTTSDPETLISMFKSPTDETFISIMHPEFQKHWYDQLQRAEARQEFRAKDPKIQYYLTRQGQMEFFVKKALDPEIDTKSQLTAMMQAGKLKGYYSEKIQLLHENAPQQNIQQNFIMGTELTNRFRLFMEEKQRAALPPTAEGADDNIEDALVVQPQPDQQPEPQPDWMN